MIKFRCGSCKQKIAVPDEYAGHTVKCPGCTSALCVPAMQAVASSGQSTGLPEPPQASPSHEPTSALAQMAAEALDDPVDVPLAATAPEDIEQQRADRRPRRSVLAGDGDSESEPPADEPADDAAARAAAQQAEREEPSEPAGPRVRPAEPEPQADPQVPPAPRPVRPDPMRHSHRARMKVPAYWFLMIGGWLCMVAAVGCLTAAVGTAIVNVWRVLDEPNVAAASAVRAAALAQLAWLVIAAFVAGLLGAIALVVRRTAINTWLLRHHFIGH